MTQYTSGELAKITGVSIRTIRYYDQQDLLHPASTLNGRRIYNDQAITVLKTISLLKVLGFHLTDIRQILEQENPNDFIQANLDEQLQSFKTEIDEAHQSIATIKALQPYLSHLNDLPITQIGAMGDIMENKKALRNTRITLFTAGIIIDIVEIAAFVLSLRTGQLWWFIGAIVFAIVGAICLVNFMYRRVAYVCPNCGFIFRPTKKAFFFSAHTFATRKLKCPNCHETNSCLEISAEAQEY